MQDQTQIVEKIQLALDLTPGVKEHLGRVQMLSKVLKLEEHCIKSREIMRRVGISAICRTCALEGDGSGCCSKKIEEWYDVPILIINNIMGVKLPSSPFNRHTCVFLGERGCTLLARYHFCINYLCKKIEDAIPQRHLDQVRTSYGKEIFIAWELEREIWRYLNMNL